MPPVSFPTQKIGYVDNKRKETKNIYFTFDLQSRISPGSSLRKNFGYVVYRLFPGNTHDSQTLMPMLSEVKKRYGVKRFITVTDKGLNSGDNIAFNTVLYLHPSSQNYLDSYFRLVLESTLDFLIKTMRTWRNWQTR